MKKGSESKKEITAGIISARCQDSRFSAPCQWYNT